MDSKTIRNNFDLLKAMGTVVFFMNDEEAADRAGWYSYFPDGADDDDLLYIAADDELTDWICRAFVDVVAEGGEGGWDTYSPESRSRGMVCGLR